jgi:hypothetical protein
LSDQRQWLTPGSVQSASIDILAVVEAGRRVREEAHLGKSALAARGGGLLAAVPFGLLLICAVMTRIIGLDLVLTTDEGHWIQRTVRFGAALERGDLASTLRAGHPGVTVTWIGLLGLGPTRLQPLLATRFIDEALLQRADGYLEALSAARFAIALVTAVLVVICGWLTWRLLGPGPGLLGGLLLVLDPYVIGSTRLLHVDALLAPLMAVSALAGLVYWIGGGGRRYLLLSAAAAGLAMLTKAPAAYLILYSALLTLLAPRAGGALQRIGSGLVWVVVVGLVCVLLWPALWVSPTSTIASVARFAFNEGGTPHGGSNFFLGRVTTDDPGPLFYPVALAYRLGPVVLLGLLALPLSLWRRKRTGVSSVFWLVAFVVLFLEVMTLGAKKFDRYALPAIVVLDLLGGVGLWALASVLRRTRSVVAALIVPVAVQVGLLGWSYPYPIAYYNPLLGGAAGARGAIMVGWGEGLEQAVDYLDAQPGSDRLTATTAYSSALRPRFRGTTRYDLAQGPTDYFVLYTNMAQRQQIPGPVQLAMQAGGLEFTGYIKGVPYVWVYRLSSPTEGRADVINVDVPAP